MSMKEAEKRNIVIIGGGIIGTTTAYFLSRHTSYNPLLHHISIIEATSLASAASGKAGGLLALWAYPSCIVPLSYHLHAELAMKHNGAERWGYRPLHCASIYATAKQQQLSQLDSSQDFSFSSNNTEQKQIWEEKLSKVSKNSGAEKNLTDEKSPVYVPHDLNWIDKNTIEAYSEMGTPHTTAQVHPYLFTNSMADLAVEAGVKIIYGRVTDIDFSSNGVRNVTYEDKTSKISHELPVTDVILATGPWTSQIFPLAPIHAIRAHSVLIKAEVSPYAIFSEISLPKNFKGGRHMSLVTPEIYPRPDGTVYVCGDSDSLVSLPQTSDLVECDESRCQGIIDHVSSISTVLREGKVLKKQACYLPSVKGNTNGPLIGKTKFKGLLLATGHTCWGIQNSCATGKLISEIIFDGKAKSANIDSLDPRHFL
ncbi:putative oxidoreductase C1F5.03c [Erysiphe neolycopersici]|uniref:Putative oxidoreductase C1F5.03c n=1 Tax=Erysiphe neolycopersici TaxID=212602 RepID=A0A420HGR4_9PEZI|nr:putative oxidoreductase C1F5.03c [Erysiphe neolycopersici]